jgi:hypothetical protein
VPDPTGVSRDSMPPTPAVAAFLQHLLGEDSEAAVGGGEMPCVVDGFPVTISLTPERAGPGVRPYHLAARRATPLIAVRGGVAHAVPPGALLFGQSELNETLDLSGVVPRIVVGVPPLDAAAVLELTAADFAVVLAGDGEQAAAELHRRGHVDEVTPLPAAAATLVRGVLAHLPADAGQVPPSVAPLPPQDGDLLDLVPFPIDETYDMATVLRTLVDGGDWLTLRSGTAPEVITGLARLDGRAVGLVASRPAIGRGRLTAAGCVKIAHCVRLCDAFHLPLLFLVDTEGLASGEEMGDRLTLDVVSAAVRRTYAATVPKCAVVTGRAYGLAALVLGATGARADYVAAWPRAEIALGAPEEAAAVPGAPPATALHERAAIMRAAQSGAVLDVIHPAATRAVLIEMLDLLRGERLYDRVVKEHARV